MIHPLFIYGTLHPDRAPAAIADTARLLKSLGRATIQGRLYPLGEYPGVILSPGGPDGVGAHAQEETVPGELFSIPYDSEPVDGETILVRLDAYEDFRPAAPESSLFLRQLTRAILIEGEAKGTAVTCWIYTYNQAVGSSLQLPPT